MTGIKELQLGMLSEKWLQTKEIVIYGFGVIAKKCIDMLMQDFAIPYIIDNAEDKKGTFYRGVPIMSQEEAFSKTERYPIVIIGTVGVYESISRMLTNAGYIENEDYCIVDLFVAEWYWHNRKQVHLVEVHTTITTRCTLNCQNCNMFMPYYEHQTEISFDEFRENMDALFRVADKIFSVGILGGEPLLNKQLGDMILYLQENYGQRIGEISVITNGTILPDEELIQILKKSKVRVHISDYTNTVPYSDRLKAVEAILKKNNVEYRVNSSLTWCDFGFPQNCFDFKDVRSHMMECFPVFRGVNDSKMYFCHVAWSAEKLGFYHLKEEDYIDLNWINKDERKDVEAFLNYSLGGNRDWYLSFCRLCGGCGSDNKKYVQAGLQAPRKGRE